MSAPSYWSLYGESSTKAVYRLQETPGTVFANAKGGAWGSLSFGGGGTITATDGPGAQLVNALRFSGGSSTNYLSTAVPASLARPFTVAIRVRTFTDPPAVSSGIFGIMGSNAATDYTGLDVRVVSTNTALYYETYRASQTPASKQTTHFRAPSGVAWRTYVVTESDSPATKIYENGVLVATNTGTNVSGIDNLLTFAVGSKRFGNSYTGFDAADVWFSSREWDAGDIAQWSAMGEPTYTSGATLTVASSTITGSVGTWDDKNNGTATYEWRVKRSGSTVASGTGSSPSASGIYSTGTYTLEVRASNTGGYDVGDTGDGWYAVASQFFAAGGYKRSIKSSIKSGIKRSIRSTQ